MAVLNFVQKGLAEPRNVWRMEEVTNNNKPTMPLLAGTNDQTTRLAQTDTVGTSSQSSVDAIEKQ